MKRSGSTWRIWVGVLVSALGAAGWWALSQVWAAPVVPRQQARTVRTEDDIKQLVVMLQGTLADQSFNGAGILIGHGADRLYIATANHVVRQGAQQAERVQVQFKWLPGEPKEAKVLDHVEPLLDLAVLMVSPTQGLAIPDLPWSALSNPEALKSGQKLFPIGFAGGIPWDRPVTPHLFHDNTVRANPIRGRFRSRLFWWPPRHRRLGHRGDGIDGRSAFGVDEDRSHHRAAPGMAVQDRSRSEGTHDCACSGDKTARHTAS